jgi:anti-sigma B factor antagonist
MQLTIKEDDDVTVVSILDSRLDASIAPEFKAQMEEIIKQGNQQIILDISSISFMDSSSLGAMVAVLKAMGNNGKLVILGASGVVLELFKLTRMDRVFNLATDLNEAKKEFSSAV